MDKILLYPSSDVLGQHLRSIDLEDKRSIDGLDKFAGEMHPDVRKFVDSWEPMDGHTAWLIDALGSDVYGNNINGDRFPKEMLAHEGEDYGHKTFERFGYPFFHHINKDPKFAYGPKVPLAVWEPRMERVQVVAWWSHELCGDLMDRLLDGEVVDVSMGCRVPFDRCTVCGNKARKRSQYCDHLRNEMNVLYPNGIRVGAENWYPKFFDISRVVRGAEKCSKFMVPIGVSFRGGRILKTAEVISYDASRDRMSSAELFEKVAGALPHDVELLRELTDLDAKVADEKTADIEKEVSSNLSSNPECLEMSEQLLEGMGRLRRIEPDLPPEMLNSMGSEHSLKSILTTMLGLGVVPKPKEFQRVVLVSIGRKDDADRYEREGQCFGEHDHEGRDHDVDLSSVIGGASDLSPDIGKMLGPLLAGRSCYKPALAGRTMVIIKRAAAGPINFDELADQRERKPLPLGPLAIGLAAMHGAFKQRMTGSGMAELGAAAAKNPVLLALLTALGIGAVEANRQIAITRSNPFAIEKQGSIGGMGVLSRFLGLPAAAYIYSDMQEAKRLRGDGLTRAQDFVRRNPDLTSIGLVMSAPSLLAGSRSGLRGVGSLFKHSSLLGEIGSTIPMYALFAKAGPALPLAATGAALDVAIFEGLGKLLGSNAEGS